MYEWWQKYRESLFWPVLFREITEYFTVMCLCPFLFPSVCVYCLCICGRLYVYYLTLSLCVLFLSLLLVCLAVFHSLSLSLPVTVCVFFVSVCLFVCLSLPAFTVCILCVYYLCHCLFFFLSRSPTKFRLKEQPVVIELAPSTCSPTPGSGCLSGWRYHYFHGTWFPPELLPHRLRWMRRNMTSNQHATSTGNSEVVTMQSL